MNKAELLAEIDRLRYRLYLEPRSRLQTRRPDLLRELAELRAETGMLKVKHVVSIRPKARPLRGFRRLRAASVSDKHCGPCKALGKIVPTLQVISFEKFDGHNLEKNGVYRRVPVCTMCLLSINRLMQELGLPAQ